MNFLLKKNIDRNNLHTKILKTNHVSALYVKTLNNQSSNKYLEFSKKNNFKLVNKKSLKKYINSSQNKNSLLIGIFYKNLHIANIRVYKKKKNLFMCGFLVFDGYRGYQVIQKIFFKIFKYNFFKKNKISFLYLNYHKDNKVAGQLYKKIGFKKLKGKGRIYFLKVKKFINR